MKLCCFVVELNGFIWLLLGLEENAVHNRELYVVHV